MERYSYNGPVLEFDRLVQNYWKGTTMAESEKKARNNLAYQWKKQNNRTANSKVFLPGKLETGGV